jgi:hypothetical protein
MNGLQMKYFVLKPAGKSAHAKASRGALRQYAKLISDENPTLANDLFEWAKREQVAALDDPDAAPEVKW